MKKLLFIGLDCASPQLLFKKFRKSLSNINWLMENGIYGELRSTIPAITIPAWASMMTSKDPGTLGMYGFRDRKPGKYKEIEIINSNRIEQKTIWDFLREAGKKSAILGFPPSFPPFSLLGWCVSGLLTPDARSSYTYPPSLEKEVEKIVGRYIFDIEFRKENKKKVQQELYQMVKKQYKVAKYLLTQKPWDFFMFVDIGLDRIQHCFWKNQKVIRDYYIFIDKQIGDFLKLIDKETAVMIASDHGAKEMKGAFCINEWLEKEGYLKFKEKPKKPMPFGKAKIDWQRTEAWAWGGYYARIFLNLKGREKQGVIEQKNYGKKRKELEKKIKSIKLPNGKKMKNKVFLPEKIYKNTKGNPPDLMIYFDNLSWRSAGTVGHPALYLKENDIGPDDAVHDQNGAFIFYNPQQKKFVKRKKDIEIYDIAPTILHYFGLKPSKDILGKSII